MRPVDFCQDDSPFYIATNTNKLFDTTKDKWFKKQPVGANKIKTFMKRMAATLDGSEAKGLSNHSARKFLVQKLSDSDVPPTEIIQISGHKNVSSVNSYSHVNTKKHKIISAMITSDENQEQEEPTRKKNKTPNATTTESRSGSSNATSTRTNIPAGMSNNIQNEPNWNLGFDLNNLPHSNPMNQINPTISSDVRSVIPVLGNVYFPVFNINIHNYHK